MDAGPCLATLSRRREHTLPESAASGTKAAGQGVPASQRRKQAAVRNADQHAVHHGPRGPPAHEAQRQAQRPGRARACQRGARGCCWRGPARTAEGVGAELVRLVEPGDVSRQYAVHGCCRAPGGLCRSVICECPGTQDTGCWAGRNNLEDTHNPWRDMGAVRGGEARGKVLSGICSCAALATPQPSWP